ncbi:MAG TPA: protein kinase [Dehalococcoidia bacterium]
MQCPSCNRDNPEDAAFCNGCGSPLELRCAECGRVNPTSSGFCNGCGSALFGGVTPDRTPTPEPSRALPSSFAGGRYDVKRLLGEGGRKRVYLAHDDRLDRDVAVAIIKTEGLDEAGLSRVKREAQSMGRLGDHPNIVTIHDIGEDGSQPYIVSQYMSGGDLDGLLQRSETRQLDVAAVLKVGNQICGALDHAHARGVIHRDLKPGNIWLTEEGDAKLGDFGLAVALDRSRVTMEGMMVGTVAYMPPEQALGRQADARSDLYSLGCVLYECLTGRPPFAGDDPTAIISQHINMTPVAPSWHTEHCPPDLENIVLGLLAKDPDERPASAAEVAAALGQIDPEQKSATHSDSNVLDRLARGVFVGREQELERLRKAADASFAGRGEIVMLVGEPGIGKTRTTQEVETYARMRGAAVLWGMGHESAGAPSYWPWMQVGRSYGQAYDLAELVPDMDGKGPELIRIFPELRQLLDAEQPEATSDPEAAQFRLFDAYTTFVRAMAKKMPLVIVLDDLHWADKPSLSLLRHLARELSRMRVLVVGTFRDTELARTHPLSEALAELNRESGFQRVVLRGLSREEVAGYIRAATNVEPQRQLVDRIFEETEGNPFFLSEVVNLLTQEGAFSKESISDISVPDGVREALGRRLDLLSEEANELLAIAAIAGREFTYETLSLLGEGEEETVLRLIEEALEARVIEELPQAGRYRFTHALMQETLLSELSTTRRVRIHGQVGEALERRWGERADERATRLAQHFVEAAMLTPRHAERAMHYSKLAAEQAEAQYGWDEAARHYEDCLTLAGSADEQQVDSEKQLLLSLGICARNAGDYRKSWRSLMRAMDIAREQKDAAGMAQAAIEAQQMIAPPGRQMGLVDEALDALGDGNPYLEAKLLTYQLRPSSGEASADQFQAIRDRVMQLVERHGYEDVRARVIYADAVRLSFGGDPDEAARLLGEAFELFSSLGETRLAANALFFQATNLWFSGQVDAAMEIARKGFGLARRHHQQYHEENCAGIIGSVLLARCEFDEFDAFVKERAADASFFLPMLAATRAEISGDLARSLALLPSPATAGGYPTFLGIIHSTRARVLYNSGKIEEAKPEFEQVLEAAKLDPGRVQANGVPFNRVVVPVLDEAFAALADKELLTGLPWHDWQRGILFDGIGRCIVRARGAIALSLGDVELAEELFAQALALCERERLPIDVGRCHAGLAEVAEHRGDVKKALQHLDQAAEIFQKHSATLYLDRAIAKKVKLQGIESGDIRSSIDAVAAVVESQQPDLRKHASPDGTVTLLFSDIEGSTAKTEELGDQRWMEVLREHNAIVREQLAAHGGFEVKSEGDGFMLAFQSARKALQCAVETQKAFAKRAESSDVPINVRMGLHTGEVIKEGDDFFGKHVNFAARIAGQAAGGEILVSSLLKELTEAGGDIEFGDGREVELKGLTGPHQVYGVAW